MRTKEAVVEEFRKRSICDAAMHVVARKGIGNVTVQDIADEAGLAKGTIYIYFKSRDEILTEAMEHAIENLLEKLAAACRPYSTFRDILEQRVRTQLQYFEENRELFRIYLAMSEPLGERRLRKHPTYQAYLAQLEEILHGAIARGEIRDVRVDRLAVSITSVVREIVLHRIIEREPTPLEDDVTYAIDFILRGIAAA